MLLRVATLMLLIAAFLPAATEITWQDLKANVDNWVEGPVGLIVTEQERDIFKKLKTPEEKMQFVKIFWARRDPILRTRENEYKQEFYQRVEQANQQFEEKNVPGWKTARGQVYVLFGPPSREDKQLVPGSNRPALLWVYDKRPADVLPPNEALFFVYRDFKYVLQPPNPVPGDVLEERQRAIESGFRYQTIPAMVQRAFAEVSKETVIDERRNYDPLLYSVETSEKFGIAGIDFDLERPADGAESQVLIPVEEAPVYDDRAGRFAEFYIRQELKKGDAVVASNERTASFNWSDEQFEDLKQIAIPLPALKAPAGQYELSVTVQDRVSNVSETKTFPVR